MAVKKFLFIRHGRTRSNAERRYIGDPGEPLCPEGIRAAEALAASGKLPPVDALLCGPALRCRQTAELLFPQKPYAVCPLREIDFGVFKGKNADDLFGDQDYGRWLATGCMGDIPGGDSVAAYIASCRDAFLRIAGESGAETTALVIHGGNIMAILSELAEPKRDFFDSHIANCGWILCGYENGALTVECERHR